jgi:hypothetical protein
MALLALGLSCLPRSNAKRGKVPRAFEGYVATADANGKGTERPIS